MKHSLPYSLLLAVLGAIALPGCLPQENADDAKNPLTAQEKQKAEEKRKAEEARKIANEQRIALQNKIKGILKQHSKNTRDFVQTARTLLADKEFQDRVHQEFILAQLLERSRPFWGGVGNINDVADLLPLTVNELVPTDRIGVYSKRSALLTLAYHYCDREMYKEAEATVRRALELKTLSTNDIANIYVVLADIYRYQDKYDEAMKVLKDAKHYSPFIITGVMADLALCFDKEDEAEAFWNECGDIYEKLRYYTQVGHSYKGHLHSAAKQRYRFGKGMREALDYVANLKNPEDKRFSVAAMYLFSAFGTDEMSTVRHSLAGIPANHKGNGSIWQVVTPFQYADYRLADEMCEILQNCERIANDPKFKKVRMISKACNGKTAEAVQLAEQYAKESTTTPLDQMRYRFYAAILSGKPTDDLMKNTTLTRKEQSQVYLSAARQCLLWHKTEESMKYAALYEKFFAEKPNQVLNVHFSDTPVTVEVWRKLYPSLQKQLCDIPFKGSMDFLETDVATGQRSVHFEKNSKISHFMEVSSLFDTDRLHIFLRVEDENARRILNGFAHGMGTEMYFAPGRNQPYICMGSSPAKGIEFMFQTTYSNKSHHRINKDNPDSFRQEVVFTDNDYVLHFSFSWKNFFDKLPSVSGTDYRYECISWTPAGGFSWGGSQGIHSASNWGSLHIQPTASQLTAIRKNLLFRTFRNWKNISKDHLGINLFDYWADNAIGDPEFYKTALVPFEKELAGYAAMVKEDMSDEDVNLVYTKGAMRWMCLTDEIDRLRRIYLSEYFVR